MYNDPRFLLETTDPVFGQLFMLIIIMWQNISKIDTKMFDIYLKFEELFISLIIDIIRLTCKDFLYF